MTLADKLDFLGTALKRCRGISSSPSLRHKPGCITPSFSVSKVPVGVYIDLEFLDLLKKLCNKTQVITMSVTLGVVIRMLSSRL